MENLVVFTLSEIKLAMTIECVDRVVNATEIQLLPNKFEHIEGTINLKGTILPVVNMRDVFQLPPKEIDLSDKFIIVHTSAMKLALHVDDVQGVVTSEQEQLIQGNQFILNNQKIEGIIKLNNERILITNIDQFVQVETIQKIKTYMRLNNQTKN